MKSLVSPGSAAGVPENHHATTDHPHASATSDLFPGTTPAELVELVHDQPMTTSRRVAQMFGKDHKNVLSIIRRLLPDLPAEFSRLNFEPRNYTDDRGKEQPEYLLTQDGFLMLAMGFTGRPAIYWRAQFIRAFNQMARTIQRQHKALMTRERDLIRAEVARSHSAVNAILADTRAERGNAMTGQCIGVDRSTLDADTLRLLHRVETLDIKLLIRGADRDTRKAELRALVLKAQATAQALEADDLLPLPSIGGAA